MLRWFRRKKNARPNAVCDDGYANRGDGVRIIEHLVSLGSAIRPPEALMRAVDRYLRLPPDEQATELLELYLLFENFLVAFDPARRYTRESLRALVRDRYPSVLELPHIRLAFQPRQSQERELCAALLSGILFYARDALGERYDDLFSPLDAWISHPPEGATVPVLSDKTLETPKTHDEWLALYRTIARETFSALEGALPQKTARTIYDRAFEEVADIYGSLDTFAAIARLLPDATIDEKKIRLLSGNQFAREILDKNEQLQSLNEQLTTENRELKRLQEASDAVREDLKRRIKEQEASLKAEIEQREVAVQARRESETRFRRVVECLGEGIIITDLDDVILYVNPRMAEMTGYRPEEMIGKVAHKLLLTENEQGNVGPRMDARRRDISEQYEVQLRRKNGSVFWVEVNAQPYRDHKGKIVGTLGTNVDITTSRLVVAERNRLEEQIRHAQQLESLGVLAGGIAHDFNNLLTSMLGHAALAHRKLPEDSPVLKNIRQIETAAQRAAELTKQMLAYSGKGKLLVEPVSLTKIVEDMAHLMRTVISKKATIETEFAEDLPIIEADTSQIQQVVMNLITNASDALEGEAGTIGIAVGRITLTRQTISEFTPPDNLREGEYVSLEISDTGCGMSPDTVTKIFDPFFSTKFSGRGLGLAAVLGIVGGHGGAIRVETELGRGTKFTVLFPPSEKRKAEQPADSPPEEKWTTSGTFLIVDDERYVRIIAKTILEDVGFTILTASDGREGVEMFRRHADEIVAVLLDMTMPYMNGDEVFREMRKAKPDITVIFSSGYDERENVQNLDTMGHVGFIQKPYQPQVLVETVRALLDH